MKRFINVMGCALFALLGAGQLFSVWEKPYAEITGVSTARRRRPVVAAPPVAVEEAQPLVSQPVGVAVSSEPDSPVSPFAPLRQRRLAGQGSRDMMIVVEADEADDEGDEDGLDDDDTQGFSGGAGDADSPTDLALASPSFNETTPELVRGLVQCLNVVTHWDEASGAYEVGDLDEDGVFEALQEVVLRAKSLLKADRESIGSALRGGDLESLRGRLQAILDEDDASGVPLIQNGEDDQDRTDLETLQSHVEQLIPERRPVAASSAVQQDKSVQLRVAAAGLLGSLRQAVATHDNGMPDEGAEDALTRACGFVEVLGSVDEATDGTTLERLLKGAGVGVGELRTAIQAVLDKKIGEQQFTAVVFDNAALNLKNRGMLDIFDKLSLGPLEPKKQSWWRRIICCGRR